VPLSTALAACGGGGGGGGSAPSAVQVTTIVPPTGAFIGGTPVTIHGIGFSLLTPNEVLFGSAAATGIVTVDAQTITCLTPAGAPGSRVDVVVRNDQGEGPPALGFLYAIPAPPTSDVNGDGLGDLLVASAGRFDRRSRCGRRLRLPRSRRSRSSSTASMPTRPNQARRSPPGRRVRHVRVRGRPRRRRPGGPAREREQGRRRGRGRRGRGLPVPRPDRRRPGHPGASRDDPADRLGRGPGRRVRLVTRASATSTADGQVDLLASAPKHDVAGELDAGCVYVFMGGATLASRSADLADRFVDGVGSGDRLGARIGLRRSRRRRRDGPRAGAPNSDVQSDVLLFDAGRVYVLSGGPSLVPERRDGARRDHRRRRRRPVWRQP
jgi:hypothetical protein